MPEKAHQRGFYLGTDKAERRFKRLLEVAAEWDTTPSGLLQMIADGAITLRPGIVDPEQIRGYGKPRQPRTTKAD